MATINQALLDRLATKLNVSKARVYALIQQISNKNRVRRHIGALLLAGDNGISIQKYATAEDHAELRGMSGHVPVSVNTTLNSEDRSKVVPRKSKVAKVSK